MASTNQRDEWIDTGHQSDNISQENEGSQNTTASAAIRQSIAGESRYRDARVPSDVAGQILHRIHEERKLQHEIAKAALVVEEHKLRMFDKIANEITNGEAREVRIGEIISRLGPAIEGSRGEQEALVANLGQVKPQEATADLQQLHVPLEASQLRFENWDWRLRGRNIRIAFSDEENQDARDVEAPIEVYHVRLLRNAEKNCSRLVVDFSTADTARIEARRAAAASREAILSQSADDLAEAAAASREVDAHEELEDLADAQRNLHLTREAEHLAYASAATHGSAKLDGESENLPDTASTRANTQHSIALPPGGSARETQGADDERDDESSHDNDDELVTPAATKFASSAHDKQLSPSQKRTASSAESTAAETARQVRELDTAPSENEESAVISDDHPSRERLLLAFLKRQGFVLGHVEPPFTIDALLRPGHVYREGTSRREHDYFYVDTDLESALTEFPDLREEFAAFVRAHGGSADTALAKEQKSAESSSRSRNSASTPQTQETAFDNRAARVLFLDMLGPLRCQDYVDYFVARGWALGSLQRRGGRDGSESEILIRPKHRFKVASSVRGQDFVGRENEAELREYILESAAATEDFGRFRIERADSGKRGVFSATTSPSHLPTFFAQLRSKNALKTSRTDLIAMELRSVCDLTRDMLEDDDAVKGKSRCTEKDEGKEQKGSEHGPDLPSKSQNQEQTRGKRKRDALNTTRDADVAIAEPRSAAAKAKAAKAKTATASRLPSTFTASSGSDHGTARSLMPAPLPSETLSKTSSFKRVRYASLVEATENHSTREETSKSSNSVHVSEESGKTQGPGLVIDFSTEFEPAGQSRKDLLREAACGSSAWIKEPSEAHLGVRHESKDTSLARKLHLCPICYAWAIDDLIADSKQNRFLPSAACVLPDPIDVFCHGGDLVGAAGMCFTSVDAVSQHLLQAHNVSPSKQSKAARVLERHRLFSPHLDGFGASRDGLINTYVRQLVGRRHSPKSSAQEYFESRSRTQLIARIFGIVQRSMQRLLVFPEARYYLQSRATWEILVEPLDALLHVLPLSQKKLQAQGKSSSKRPAYDSRETWAQDGENLFLFCGRYARKSFRSVHIDDLPYLHYWQDRLERDATEAHLQIFARLAAWFEAEPPLDNADCDDVSSDEEEHGGARQASSRNADAWTRYGKSHKVSLGRNLAEMTFWDAFTRYPMLCVSLKKRKELPAALAAFCNWLHRSDAHPITLARSPTRAPHSRSRARR